MQTFSLYSLFGLFALVFLNSPFLLLFGGFRPQQLLADDVAQGRLTAGLTRRHGFGSLSLLRLSVGLHAEPDLILLSVHPDYRSFQLVADRESFFRILPSRHIKLGCVDEALNTVFVKLEDLGYSLPPYEEEVVILDHDPDILAATKEMAGKMRDPEALAAHAAFLDGTIGELRGLAIEDPALNKAVATYLNALEKLAGGYRKAADGLKLLHKGDYKGAGDEMAGTGSGLVMYATIVDSSRIRIADACNEP